MKKFTLALLLLFSVAGCETGYVIEVQMTPTWGEPFDLQKRDSLECLQLVAKQFGLTVEGPEYGPANCITFTTTHPKDIDVGFFISLQFTDHVSIVFRDLADNSDFKSGERAFSAFKTELDRRGLTYEVRQKLPQ